MLQCASFLAGSQDSYHYADLISGQSPSAEKARQFPPTLTHASTDSKSAALRPSSTHQFGLFHLQCGQHHIAFDVTIAAPGRKNNKHLPLEDLEVGCIRVFPCENQPRDEYQLAFSACRPTNGEPARLRHITPKQLAHPDLLDLLFEELIPHIQFFKLPDTAKADDAPQLDMLK